MNSRRVLIISTGFLGMVLFWSACSSVPGSSVITSSAGRHEMVEVGRGSPVVVFESGIGETLTTWEKVYPAVANFTQAIAYSRSGYGRSSAPASDRNGKNAVSELRAFLAERGLHGPYVLVGHSLGGLYAELYAKLYPEEVAGLVLVDPTPVDHNERLRRELPGRYKLAQAALALQPLSIASREQRGIDATSTEWHAAGSFPPRPVIILTGVKTGLLEDSSMISYKQKAHGELVRECPGAEHRLVQSGHFIQRDQPDAVITAIKDVIDRVRSERPPTAAALNR